MLYSNTRSLGAIDGPDLNNIYSPHYAHFGPGKNYVGQNLLNYSKTYVIFILWKIYTLLKETT